MKWISVKTRLPLKMESSAFNILVTDGNYISVGSIIYLDILQRLKRVGFWIQTEKANENGLTSPSPREDVPSL